MNKLKPIKDIHHYFSDGRSVVCNDCHDLGCSNRDVSVYQCHGPCQQRLGHARYAPDALRKFKQDRRFRLLCLACVDAERLREAKLRKLMRTSKRAACKCNRVSNHTEKCPMHPRTFGERPYPGCDVMTREDYEWLQARKSNRPQ